MKDMLLLRYKIRERMEYRVDEKLLQTVGFWIGGQITKQIQQEVEGLIDWTKELVFNYLEEGSP